MAGEFGRRVEHLARRRAGLLGRARHIGDGVVTSPVPVAAWATLRTISCVAAPCSSTAAAMAVATPLISRMRPPIESMARTAWPVEAWIRAIWVAMSSVARAVWPAEFLHLGGHHGEAPSRLSGAGCLDGRVEGEQVGLPGDVGDHRHHVADPRDGLVQLLNGGRGLAGLVHARRARSAEPATCRPISCTDEPSSSAEAATVVTFTAASSAATATVVDCAAVREAVPDIA